MESKPEDKKESISELLMKKSQERGNFRINIKPQNAICGVLEEKIYKQKIPASAKVPKLDYSYDDVKMVQNLPEIPKTKTKLTVKYLQESSPVKPFMPSINKVCYKILRKPLLEPIFKPAQDSSRLYLKSRSLECGNDIKPKKSIETRMSYNQDIDEATILRNKETESIKNEESLRKKCLELKTDIIKMIGGSVFNEMHNIFTSIITVIFI